MGVLFPLFEFVINLIIHPFYETSRINSVFNFHKNLESDEEISKCTNLFFDKSMAKLKGIKDDNIEMIYVNVNKPKNEKDNGEILEAYYSENLKLWNNQITMYRISPTS